MRRTPNRQNHDMPNERPGRTASVALREPIVPATNTSTTESEICFRCYHLMPCYCQPPHPFYEQGNNSGYRNPSWPFHFSSPSSLYSIPFAENPAAAHTLGFRSHPATQNYGQYLQPRMLAETPLPMRSNPNQRQIGDNILRSPSSFSRQFQQEDQEQSVETYPFEHLFHAIAEIAQRGAQESLIWKASMENARAPSPVALRHKQGMHSSRGGGACGVPYSCQRPRPSAPEMSPRSISRMHRGREAPPANQLNHGLMRLDLNESSSLGSNEVVRPAVPHLSYMDAARLRRERRINRQHEKRQWRSYTPGFNRKF